MRKIAILTTILVLLGKNVFACECYNVGGYAVKDEIVQADFVIACKAVNIIPRKTANGALGSFNTEFSVSEILKGNIGKTFLISQVSNCSYTFEIGENYLVYGRINKETNEIEASVCGRTKLLKGATEEIKEIKTLVAK